MGDWFSWEMVFLLAFPLGLGCGLLITLHMCSRAFEDHGFRLDETEEDKKKPKLPVKECRSRPPLAMAI